MFPVHCQAVYSHEHNIISVLQTKIGPSKGRTNKIQPLKPSWIFFQHIVGCLNTINFILNLRQKQQQTNVKSVYRDCFCV